MAKTREFDVVLYGATGFVGQQTAAYFAKYLAVNPSGLRWAIAGRSQARLQSVLDGLGKAASGVGLIVADAMDAAALAKLASRAKVVLTTAGPYAKFGSELLGACVKHGTHYVDITGETPWVRRMIDAHHADAEKAGTKIVPFCGFDSIPSDLGVAILASAMREQHGQGLTSVKSAFTLSGGGLNGGTASSLMNIMDTGQGDAVQDLFLLNPAGTRPASDVGHEDPISPHSDKDFKGWIGPFIMGAINTRVVRRSAALRGDVFTYQEHMRFGQGISGALFASAFSVGSLASQSMLKFGPLRRMANKFVPQAGEGPSEAAMNKGFFKCELVATGAKGQRMRCVISYKGDAGNRATTVFVCECALALAQDFDKLPKSAGVITPTHAFGGSTEGVLAMRLRSAGMRVDVTTLDA